MGDVLTLIERAEEQIDREQADKMERKLREASFTLEDFLDQLQQVKKMGPLSQVLGMLPGMSQQLKGVEVDDRDVARVEAIIRSMTPGERNNPKILNGSRRARIARGSGTTTQQVNALLKQFEEAPDDEAAVGHDAQEAAPDGPALGLPRSRTPQQAQRRGTADLLTAGPPRSEHPHHGREDLA
jgi:signal recognition particle GTPase